MAMPTKVNNPCEECAVIDNGIDIIVQMIPGPVKRGLLRLDRRELVAVDTQVSIGKAQAHSTPMSTPIEHFHSLRLGCLYRTSRTAGREMTWPSTSASTIGHPPITVKFSNPSGPTMIVSSDLAPVIEGFHA